MEGMPAAHCNWRAAIRTVIRSLNCSFMGYAGGILTSAVYSPRLYITLGLVCVAASAQAASISGEWEGTWYCNYPPECAGENGTWEATLRADISGNLTGHWYSYFPGPGPELDGDISGSYDGTTATWYVNDPGYGPCAYEATVNSAGTSLSGTFWDGPECGDEYEPVEGTFQGTKTSSADDEYEPNNTMDEAYSLQKKKWLKNIAGYGRLYDDDWFKIYVSEGSERVQVDCRFTHAYGDIDIELHTSSGDLVAGSWGTSNNEFIDYTVTTYGTYYILVHPWSGCGNVYDLWWDAISGDTPPPDGNDDSYEENDSLAQSWNFSTREQTWLKNIAGYGRLYDDDWFKIYVSEGSERVQVDCRFTHAYSNIDIELLNSSGDLVTGSWGTSNKEFIDYTVTTYGTYYIFVYDWSGCGNVYDLWWDAISGDTPPPDGNDDSYEENDSLAQSWNFSTREKTWLSDISGYGRQYDDDWFKIYVSEGSERVQVDCRFTHADGDIDIELYDRNGNRLAYSNGSSDNAFIEYSVTSHGTYYIRVHYGNRGNRYNLWWDDIGETPPPPTGTRPINLTPNETAFSPSGTFSVKADVWPITVRSYPFVRVVMPGGSMLWYEAGKGFSPWPVPYLGFAAGPIRTSSPILGYPVLSIQFSGIARGTYYLEGGAVDATRTLSASNLVYFGKVDKETLTVH